MRSIKVTKTDGDYFSTNINGTNEEILRYYLGQWTNTGDTEEHPGDRMVFFDSVQFLDESAIVDYYEANGLSAPISEGWGGIIFVYDLRADWLREEPHMQNFCYWGNYATDPVRAFEEAEYHVKKEYPNALLVKVMLINKGKDREVLIFGPPPTKN